VQRTLVAWLVALPAAAGGVLAAHGAAYALAGAGARPSHGYLPVAEAAVCALLALGLAAATLAARAGHLARPPAVAFALVPPLAFVLQEAAEREFAAPLELVVVLGLALQLPFALLAYLVARVLLRVAEALVALPRSGRAVRRPLCVANLLTFPQPTALVARVGRGPPPATAS